MKIASYNVNGIRARLSTVKNWLKSTKPDVAVLQEIKTTDETFPTSEIENLGYNVTTNGQKGFNGLALLSRYPISDVKYTLDENTEDLQSRWLEAEINSIKICGLYLPNGNPCPGPKFDYKINWMNLFYNRAADIINNEETAVMLGDYNVIPQREDAANPEKWLKDALFHPKVRTVFQRILNLGFTDALRVSSSADNLFTFWDYQKGSWQKNDGIRIDHILLSPQTADRLQTSGIDSEMRGDAKPSDHVPIWIKLDS